MVVYIFNRPSGFLQLSRSLLHLIYPLTYIGTSTNPNHLSRQTHPILQSP